MLLDRPLVLVECVRRLVGAALLVEPAVEVRRDRRAVVAGLKAPVRLLLDGAELGGDLGAGAAVDELLPALAVRPAELDDPGNYNYYSPAPKPPGMSDAEYRSYLGALDSFNELTCSEERGAQQAAELDRLERKESQPEGWEGMTPEQKTQYEYEHYTKYIPLQDTSIVGAITWDTESLADCVHGGEVAEAVQPEGGLVSLTVGCLAGSAYYIRTHE